MVLVTSYSNKLVFGAPWISCSAFKLHSQNLIKFLWGGPASQHKKCNLDVEQLIEVLRKSRLDCLTLIS